MSLSYKEKLEYFKKVKEEVIQNKIDFEDVALQSSYRKLRHHLDRIIVRLSSNKIPL